MVQSYSWKIVIVLVELVLVIGVKIIVGRRLVLVLIRKLIIKRVKDRIKTMTIPKISIVGNIILLLRRNLELYTIIFLN